MSLLDKLFGRKQDAIMQQPSNFNAFYSRGQIPYDLRLSSEQAMTLSSVYACVRVIAESLSASPWNVYTLDAAGRRTIAENDSLSYILNVRPNPDVGAQSFKEGLVSNALIYGDGYAEIVFDKAGRVSGLSLIPSTQVTPKRSPGGEFISSSPPRQSEPGELVYQINPPQFEGQEGGPTIILGQDQIFHLKSLASVNGLLGDGPVTRAAMAMSTAKAAEQYAINYYANNASLGGILTLPRTLKPDEQKELEDRFTSERSGAGRAFKTLFLGPGSTFTQLDGNASDAAVVEMRQYSTEDIARYFGVPGHLIGVALASQGWGRNLSDLYNVFVRNTLIPWSKRLEQEANFKLITARSGKTTCIDMSWLTQGDAEMRSKVNDVYLRNGTLTVNEVREAEGYNNIGDPGDLHVLDGVLLDEEALTSAPQNPSVTPGDTEEVEPQESMADPEESPDVTEEA